MERNQKDAFLRGIFFYEKSIIFLVYKVKDKLNL
jgi:hypothetical protein